MMRLICVVASVVLALTSSAASAHAQHLAVDTASVLSAAWPAALEDLVQRDAAGVVVRGPLRAHAADLARRVDARSYESHTDALLCSAEWQKICLLRDTHVVIRFAGMQCAGAVCRLDVERIYQTAPGKSVWRDLMLIVVTRTETGWVVTEKKVVLTG